MKSDPDAKEYDVIIIGGGQAALSVAYFLRRTRWDYIILDKKEKAGGSWLNTWDNLKLFSPSAYSSLSGWRMPSSKEEYPTKNEFIAYLRAYEMRYDFPIKRGVKVNKVIRMDSLFKVETDAEEWAGKVVVSATGTGDNPFIPHYPKMREFEGRQIHSINYRNPNNMSGKKVLLIGGGNSGAQILAEVSKVAKTKWVTLDTPHFLPKEIDGRYLFNQATARYYGKETRQSRPSLGDIVQVASVQEGLKREIYQDYRPFRSFYKNGVIWENGDKEEFDIVIWCTGFKPNLSHLRSLKVVKGNSIKTKGTKSIEIDGLWLVGYGNWTGFASATIYGVGKTAKQTVQEINAYLG